MVSEDIGMAREIGEGAKRLSIFLGGVAMYVTLVGFFYFERDTDHNDAVVFTALAGTLAIVAWAVVRAIAWVIEGFKQE